ncbi:hypothetical protein [Burkholderia stagnalis]|uniref:TRAFAC clade GTPase domain-containing protein n=1 Tax=Burkholderia stagnalis TaxID=1503054 RepID=UPI0012DB2627|nr:hypothetical protein [Burkholderia stagnalis]
MPESNVLVLGGSGAGKTHYAGQLLGRLRHDRQGKLRLRPGGVEDLSKLEEVLACLEEGRAAGHTPAETWTGIRCELETNDGVNVSIEWPEYAGERFVAIMEQRRLSAEWRESINNAAGWILFVRPSTLQVYEDLLERPTGVAPKHTRSGEVVVDGKGWDDRARFVELLQMLIFAARRSTFDRTSAPRLAVVLSCWDELERPGTPEEVLATRLPLVDAFIRSNWKSHAWSVWGLSSLERALSQDERDAEFAKFGPEHFGYVIPPNSREQVRDLTAPVAWLLGV